IGQLPAATLLGSTRDGHRIAMTWIAHDGRIFRVTGLSGEREWERYRPTLERTTDSFRPLRPADRERIVEKRLRVWPARAGDTLGRMLSRGGAAWSAEQASVADGIAADARIEPGWPVERAVSERYRGTRARGRAAKWRALPPLLDHVADRGQQHVRGVVAQVIAHQDGVAESRRERVEPVGPPVVLGERLEDVAEPGPPVLQEVVRQPGVDVNHLVVERRHALGLRREVVR